MRLAWLAYLPVPFVALVPLYLGPREDRPHAWQGGLFVGLLYLFLIGAGFLIEATPDSGALRVLEGLTGAVLLLALVTLLYAAVHAARGRLVHLPLAWPLARSLGKT